ncbi:hypothetical protein GQ598_00340 [Gilliamella sp. Pas-s95]|nr:hypothetical protein [Gilliamella sp. Pas-s95]
MRRAQSAVQSIVPTSTRSVQSIDLFIPELKGKLLGGISTCPCNCRSMIDLTLNLDKKVTV